MKRLLIIPISSLIIFLSSCSGGSNFSSSTYIGTVPANNYSYNPTWNPYSYNYGSNSLNLYYHGGLPSYYNGGYPNYYNYPYNYYFPNYNHTGSLIDKKYHRDLIYHRH